MTLYSHIENLQKMSSFVEIREVVDNLQRPSNSTRQERAKWLDILIEYDNDSKRPHHLTSNDVYHWADIIGVTLLQKIEAGRELLELPDDELLQRVRKADREEMLISRRSLFNGYIGDQLPVVDLNWKEDAQKWYIELRNAYRERYREDVVSILKRGLTIKATDHEKDTIVVKIMLMPYVQTLIRRLIGSQLTHYFAWSDHDDIAYDE